MEGKWFEASKELEETKLKLERYTSTTEEWILVSNKDGTPVWKNTGNKEVITLPIPLEGFKANYQLTRVEGGQNVYTNGEKKEVKLPESLGDMLIEESTEEAEEPQPSGTKAKKGKGLRLNDTKVLNAVNASDHPLTLDELANLTGIHPNNISEYTSELVSRKLIIEGHEGTKKVYSKKTN